MAGGSWQMTIPVDRVDPGVPETLKQMLDMQLQHASDEERQLRSLSGQCRHSGVESDRVQCHGLDLSALVRAQDWTARTVVELFGAGCCDYGRQYC